MKDPYSFDKNNMKKPFVASETGSVLPLASYIQTVNLLQPSTLQASIEA